MVNFWCLILCVLDNYMEENTLSDGLSRLMQFVQQLQQLFEIVRYQGITVRPNIRYCGE